MDQDALVQAACDEIVEQTQDRKACLIFAAGVKHGEHIVAVMKERHGIDCGFVTGKTPTEERDNIIACFKKGDLKFLCNVNVLTTGFDATNVDCVALLRPTMSPGLFYQMSGRGMRLHPGKHDCLVLDFGGNVLRHGPVDQLAIKKRRPRDQEAPAKECPECGSLIATGYAVCPDCGYEFPPPDRRKHEAKASDVGPLSKRVWTTRFAVEDVLYSIHTRQGADDDAPKTMRVEYKVGWHNHQSEWVCFEHTGYPRQKAVEWWRKRSHDDVPDTVEDAVDIANNGGLAITTAIVLRQIDGEQYGTIIDYEIGPLPERFPDDDIYDYDLDDVPF